MTRIVTTHHRYKRPPRKQQSPPRAGLAVVASRARLPAPEPVVTAPSPVNDDRKATSSHRSTKSAIVATASRNRRIADSPPLSMELPLSRKPIERDGDTYKRLKAAMTRRLRGETN